MTDGYPGPLRSEPPAIELHNTFYAAQGELADGLAEPASAAAWIAGLGDRLPRDGTGRTPSGAELITLRQAVRDVLHAAVEHRVPSRANVEALNEASARAPHSAAARWHRHHPPQLSNRYHSTSRADIVISAIAADAINLVTGPDREQLRACGAPGCVLVFLKQHPRREWCSAACGNRARQARHYRRLHEPPTDD